MNDRQRLEAIVAVVCRYLPPDGISKAEAMSQIIELVDPLPEQAEKDDMYRNPDTGNPCEGWNTSDMAHRPNGLTIDDDDIQEYKKPWVGLTDEEIKGIIDCGRGGLVDIKKAEQILKERNT
jgi:hypothetical protein